MTKQLIKFQNYEPKLGANILIAEGVRIIGDVTIGDNSSIWFNSVIRGDVCPITIGTNTNIQDGTIIHVTSGIGPTSIGNNVTIGHQALIHACTIHDYGFVGMGSIMLDNSVVESFGFLAAGSVLTPGKIVKSNELWCGNPAKFKRYLTDQEIDNIKQSAIKYQKLAINFL